MQFIAARRLGLVAALAAAGAASAQPAPAASGPQPTERAQHDADKVFRMILQHADKPRRAPRDEAAPAAATPRAPVPPAAKGSTGAATAAPRSADPRVTATTPPAVPAAPTAATSPNASGVTPSSGSSDVAAPDSATAAPSQPTSTAAIAPAALAPVAVATPRSLKLELVSSVEPEFPARLVRSLGKGSVVVNFDVRPDGTVARTEVASSSHRGLNEAALSAVAAWRFKPISETLPGVVELKFE
jgi:TonB family protein